MNTEHDSHSRTPAWTVRPYRQGDEPALVALFQTVFGRQMSLAHWRWKFQGLPSRVETVAVAVDAGDQPIFHIGGVPRAFRWPGGRGTAIVAFDAMTHPQFRRHGVLSRVFTELLSRWRRAGVVLVLGLPNRQWGSRTAALGWEPLFPLRWYIRPLRPERLLSRRLAWTRIRAWHGLGTAWNRLFDVGLRPASGVEVRSLGFAGAEINDICRQCEGDLSNALVRTPQWVDWRYFNSPQHAYRVLVAEAHGAPAGYLAYRLDEARAERWGFIAEVIARRGDPDVVRALLGAAVDRMMGEGVAAVATLGVRGSVLSRVCRRAGFWFSWGAFTVHAIALAANLNLGALRRGRDWQIAGGDFDVV